MFVELLVFCIVVHALPNPKASGNGGWGLNPRDSKDNIKDKKGNFFKKRQMLKKVLLDILKPLQIKDEKNIERIFKNFSFRLIY